KATKANIVKALEWASTNAKVNDLVVFAYFGRGAPLGDRSCYFAVDSTFKGRAKDAVADADVGQILEKMKSQRFCAFMDVNFKGFDAGKDTAPDPNVSGFYQGFFGKDEETETTLGRVAYLANIGLKPSIDLEKHGLFAKVILDGLKGAADKEGYEPDGV